MNNNFRSYTHGEKRSATRRRPLHGLAAIFLFALFSPVQTIAADLKPETIQAWNDYVRAAEARSLKHVSEGNLFLAIDALPPRRRSFVEAISSLHLPRRMFRSKFPQD